ncbi:hypothetical protein CLHUN_35590 [Ruminiclostridium hungatei]|uniref:Uncharacterized protein n=1 Tax=Ruminiclostridium hungatei TaxID=48256 RepID=A0A1V4SF99_RUMHU|nr:hypothetical protein CLHUN_35590 [Ruminiclostridium hungatei]
MSFKLFAACFYFLLLVPPAVIQRSSNGNIDIARLWKTYLNSATALLQYIVYYFTILAYMVVIHNIFINFLFISIDLQWDFTYT